MYNSTVLMAYIDNLLSRIFIRLIKDTGKIFGNHGSTYHSECILSVLVIQTLHLLYILFPDYEENYYTVFMSES